MVALLASGMFAAATAATAAAQTPVEATTVTALGSASVPVRRPAKLSDATIREAVRVAEAEVGPKAVVSARKEAGRLATALGLELGTLQAVTEQSTFPFGPYVSNGTFGYGRYCGTTRRRVYRTTADGRRVATGRIRARHFCRVPPVVTTSVAVTYLAS